MIGKSLTARVVLLILAILLLILLWNYGVSSEIMLGAILLVVFRLILVLTKVMGQQKNTINSQDEEE